MLTEREKEIAGFAHSAGLAGNDLPRLEKLLEEADKGAKFSQHTRISEQMVGHIKTIDRVFHCWKKMPGYFSTELSEKKHTLKMWLEELGIDTSRLNLK